MEQTRLSAEPREVKSKGMVHALRRRGSVPGIIYGHKVQPLPIHLSERNLSRILASGGENAIINVDLGEDNSETVIIKEVQIDPLTRRIMHVDFLRVSMEELITTHVPIFLTGTAIGVGEGGILEFLQREVRVECQAGKIPEHIEVDISSLGIGDLIRVGDLKPEEGIKILDDPATAILAVGISIVHEEPEAVEVTEQEQEEAEPEVIREKRKEEEEEK